VRLSNLFRQSAPATVPRVLIPFPLRGHLAAAAGLRIALRIGHLFSRYALG